MTRWTARLALAGVSAIAAVVSYLHALAVVRAVSPDGLVVYLVPFLADLVILGASAALLDTRAEARPLLARLSLGAGIAVTLTMNIAAGFGHGLPGALVAGWPAVAFILALESLVSIVRSERASAAPERVAADAKSAARVALAASVAAGNPVSQRQLMTRFGLSRADEREVRQAVLVTANGHGGAP